MHNVNFALSQLASRCECRLVLKELKLISFGARLIVPDLPPIEIGGMGCFVSFHLAETITITTITNDTIRYDTIRDAILTCARKPTWVSLIYRTETTTKNCNTEKLNSKSRYVRSDSKSLGNHVVSFEEEKGRLRWKGIAEKGFKSGIKERVGDEKLMIITNKCNC